MLWIRWPLAVTWLLWSKWKWKEDQDTITEDFTGDSVLCLLQLQTSSKHSEALPLFLSMTHILLFPITQLHQGFHNEQPSTSVIFQEICLCLLTILGCYNGHTRCMERLSELLGKSGYGASPVTTASSWDEIWDKSRIGTISPQFQWHKISTLSVPAEGHEVVGSSGD